LSPFRRVSSSRFAKASSTPTEATNESWLLRGGGGVCGRLERGPAAEQIGPSAWPCLNPVAGVTESSDGIADPGNRPDTGHVREDVIDAHPGQKRRVRVSWRVGSTIRHAQICKRVIDANRGGERKEMRISAVLQSGRGKKREARPVVQCGRSAGVISPSPSMKIPACAFFRSSAVANAVQDVHYVGLAAYTDRTSNRPTRNSVA